MANIQKTLDALQPYVIGIRYVDGMSVIDTIFKDGWTVPESEIVKKVKGDENLNYYLIFSDKEGVGLDELLEFVSVTIKVNQEREKKHELLKVKVDELKELFKKTSLDKLTKLKFSFYEEDFTPKLDELDINLTEETVVNNPLEKSIENKDEDTSEITESNNVSNTIVETTNTENLTEEELEILEEEKRAETYRVFKEKTQQANQLKKVNKVELPPKKKIRVAIANDFNDTEVDCDCAPEEACNKCIHLK
jgi:hypothetical protein